jgi:hypothetical protein
MFSPLPRQHLIVTSLTDGCSTAVLRGEMENRCKDYRIDLFEDRISTDHGYQPSYPVICLDGVCRQLASRSHTYTVLD